MAAENVCQYNKYGHCKFRDTCRYRHTKTTCERNDCEVDSCTYRHPRHCRYFRDYGKCKFGDFCSFTHKKATIENQSGVLENEIKLLKNQIQILEKRFEENKKELDKVCSEILKVETKKNAEMQEIIKNQSKDLQERDGKIEELEKIIATLAPIAARQTQLEEESYFRFGDLESRFRSLHDTVQELKLPKSYPCDICKRTFGNERSFQNHVRSHHQPDAT